MKSPGDCFKNGSWTQGLLLEKPSTLRMSTISSADPRKSNHNRAHVQVLMPERRDKESWQHGRTQLKQQLSVELPEWAEVVQGWEQRERLFIERVGFQKENGVMCLRHRQKDDVMNEGHSFYSTMSVLCRNAYNHVYITLHNIIT